MPYAALTIDINAKLANLEAGLKGAESQLSGFAKRAEAAAAGIAASIGAVAGAVAVSAVVDRFAAVVSELSALDDAAESTGASVEELSSILNTVAPTGVGLEEITGYATKLVKAMREAEDATSAQAQAFKALNVATKESDGSFRSTGVVLEDVARALSGYADGTNKFAIAQVLLGKSGAEALPFLKDLAGRTKESATVSAEAAAEAERLANAWRAIKRDGELVAQSIAAQIIPSLANLAERFRETGKAGGTFWDQIRGVLGPNKAIADLEGDLAGLKAQRDQAKRLGLSDEAIADYEARIARVQKSIDALRPAQRQANGPSAREMLFGDAGYGNTDKPQAPSVPDGDAAKRADDARKAYAELDALVRQSDIDDTLKREAEAAKELAKALEKAADAGLRRLAENDRAEQDAEQALRTEVERWKNVADPARQYRLELERIQALEGAGVFDSSDEAERARRATIEKLVGTLSKTKTEADETKDIARDLGLTFESAFESAIARGEKLSTVLQGIAQDITRLVLRKTITEPAANYLSGIVSSMFSGGGDGLGPELNPYVGLATAAPVAVKSAAAAAASSITNIYVDSRTDRATIVPDIQRAVLAGFGAQKDAQLRGSGAV